MAELNFQAIVPERYQAAFAVQNQCQLHPWSEENFISSLRPPYFAYELIEQQQVVGFYIGHQVLADITLMDIGIAPDARGKGLGRALLQHFEQQAITRKGSEIWLEVRESNAAAISLYQQADYALIETRKNYYPAGDKKEDALIMRKVIEA